MKRSLKSSASALAGLLFLAAPALASADRIYFLVGVRHVYEIGPNREANWSIRRNIEETYADEVSRDQQTYQQHVNAGANPAQESQMLDAALYDAATQRDQALGAIYQQRDDLRGLHPQFRFEGDGPYQIVGVDAYYDGPTWVFRDYEVFAPWPGYVATGPYYGGWRWGVVYQPTVFLSVYGGWHTHYYHGWGFYGGFYGHSGPVVFNPVHYVGHFGSYGYRANPSIRPVGYAFRGRPVGSFGGAHHGPAYLNHGPAYRNSGSAYPNAMGHGHSYSGPTHGGSFGGRPSASSQPRGSFGTARSSGGSFHSSGSFGRSRPSTPARSNALPHSDGSFHSAPSHGAPSHSAPSRSAPSHGGSFHGGGSFGKNRR